MLITRASLRSMSTQVSKDNRNQSINMRCFTRPTPEEMVIAVAVPAAPHFYGLGSWVEHIAAPREAMVSELIEEYLGCSQASFLTFTEKDELDISIEDN